MFFIHGWIFPQGVGWAKCSSLHFLEVKTIPVVWIRFSKASFDCCFFYSWINISPRYWVNWIILCLFQKWQQFLQKQDLTAVFCSESEKWKFVFWASLRSWILDNIPRSILPDNRLKITIQKSSCLFTWQFIFILNISW